MQSTMDEAMMDGAASQINNRVLTGLIVQQQQTTALYCSLVYLLFTASQFSDPMSRTI